MNSDKKRKLMYAINKLLRESSITQVEQVEVLKNLADILQAELDIGLNKQ